jgi:hypothetical protein
MFENIFDKCIKTSEGTLCSPTIPSTVYSKNKVSSNLFGANKCNLLNLISLLRA